MQTLNNYNEVIIDLNTQEYATKKDAIRVLHVDDDLSILEITKQILTDMGSFEIDHACCVDEAFVKLEGGHYDVVVSDYEMPQKDGLQFLKELREQNSDIPFILFTGKGREEVVIKALNLGADGYINKQGNPETVYGELNHAIQSSFEKRNALEALETSENRHSRLFDNVPTGLAYHKVILDDHGKVIDYVFLNINEAFEKFTGLKRDKTLGKKVTEMLPGIEKDSADWIGKYGKVALTGEQMQFESYSKNLKKWYTVTAYSTEKWYFTTAFVDITELRESMVALKYSEEKFKGLFEGMVQGAFWQAADGTLLDVNQSALDVFGLTKDEFLGRTSMSPQWKVTKEDGVELSGSTHPSMVALKTGKPVKDFVAKVYNPKMGSFKILNINAVPQFKEGEKEPFQVFVTLHDLTDLKKSQEALRDSLVNYQCLINGMSDTAWVIDFTGNFLDVNDAAVKVFGYSKAELLSMGIKGIDRHLSREQVKHLLDNLPSVGNQIFETVHTTKDGSEIPVEISSSLVTYYGKQAILSIARNINQRKIAEEQLRETENRYRDIVELSPDGIATVTLKGTITSVNKAFLDLTGFSKEEIVGKNFARLPTLRKRDLPKYAKIFVDIIRGKMASFYEFVYVRKDGSTREAEARFSIIRQKSKIAGLQIYLRDLTELRNIEERYRNLADSLPEIVFEADDKGVPTFVNRQALEIMGYSKDEIKQMNILQFLVPEDRQRAKENIQRRMQGEKSSSNEYIMLRKNGSTFPGMIFTEKIISAEGKLGLKGIIVNISQNKKAAEIVQTLNEKLLVVGRLTRHDVGNRLAVIAGQSYLLRKKMKDNPELIKQLDAIDFSIASSNKLFEFSRLYERIGAEKPSNIKVAKAFSQALALQPNVITPEIINECQELEVWADSLLTELFFNLIDNSLKHGEKVTQIRLHYTKDPQGVMLIYEDNGVGISQTNKAKLFTEGFSTAKSTGLGLYLIKKMLNTYGWSITEEGELGKGAKFTIKIPKLDKNGQETFQIT
jgi:PAS domain S-box-containing protein